MAADMISGYLSKFAEHYRLSKREVDVVSAIVTHHTNIKQIAARLGVSTSTINNHLNNIYEKTETTSKAELVTRILLGFINKQSSWKGIQKIPHVLVVDDESELCNIVDDELSGRGLKVFKCSNPLEVPELITQLNLDFVICDIRMPGIDGMELLELIRKTHKYIPYVVFVTGHSDYTSEIACDRGAVGIMQKPVDYDELFRLMMQHYINNLTEQGRSVLANDRLSRFMCNGHYLNSANIGFGGAFIPVDFDQKDVPKELQEGSRFSLIFALSGNDKKISAVTEVVWKRESKKENLPSGVGVRFVNISDEDKDHISEFVRNNKIVSYIPTGRPNN